MNALKPPWEWTPSEVQEFLIRVNLDLTTKSFYSHGINGKDLIELTESDIRSDFGFLRVHDRKSLLRSISDLKKSFAFFIEIFYKTRRLVFRINDPDAYTFEALLLDTCGFLSLPPETHIIKDAKGLVIGSGSTKIIFTNQNQQEPLYLISSLDYKQSTLLSLSSSSDCNDIDEDIN